ncbi:hypothetical protein CMT49_04795 [Elizabethkingia anophelis]|nr:hypothetical protein [Elizabethkingia anophelis]
MTEFNLFIAEDDDNVIDGYKSNIDSYNATNQQIRIVCTIEKDKDVAIQILKNTDNSYDGAIIDLDLKQSGGTDSSGNEIVKEIKNNLRFPVFVISGTTHNLDPELRSESIFFKVRERDVQFDYIEEFISIFNTGITHILGRKGTINEYLNKIFWNHLSGTMNTWVSDTLRTPEHKQKSLLRYTLLHIQEYLELTEESNFEDYHPAEIYLLPPVKNKVFTGDLVTEKSTSKNFIVLTPSCDLAQSKAKDILLGEIESESEGLLNEKIGIVKRGTANAEVLQGAEKDLKALIGNSYSNKYHFLPKYSSLGSGLINFQKLKSVRVRDFETNFDRIASINSNFTKDIIARFSYYYSRQGSPDFNTTEIYNSLIQ